jgi:bifunctional polynucleotide phosphatase/kinase
MSQKAPGKLFWTERAANDDKPSTLLVGRYDHTSEDPNPDVEKRRKIAAFDLVSVLVIAYWDTQILTKQDSTLITTISKKKISSDAQDWKWWHPSVPSTLKKLYNEDKCVFAYLSGHHH